MKTFYKIILFLSGCCYYANGFAQNLNLVSPITISMPTTPVPNTDDWGKSGQPLVITAKKHTPNELQSWMLVTIKKGGAKICGSNTPQTAPEIYFDVPVKTWVGSTAASLLGNGCILQPGDYELCVQFYLKDRRTLIGENCKSFTIKEAKTETYSPPQNILPAADKIFTAKEVNGMVNFRWTPIVPKPKANVKYTVRIWDIPIKGSKNQVIKTQRPVIIKETNELTQISVSVGEFKPGQREKSTYAWNVQASKTSSMGDIETLGTSEATTFEITEFDCNCTTFDKFVSKPYVQLNGSHIKVDSVDCNGKLSTKLQCKVKYDFAIQHQFLGMWPNNPCGHFDSVVIRNATGAVMALQQHVIQLLQFHTHLPKVAITPLRTI